MRITRKSVITGIERTRDIPVNPEDYISWQKYDMSIQDAMPYLSDSDREFILTGITSQEWNDAFAKTEQEV
jgi:hypothetical protein